MQGSGEEKKPEEKRGYTIVLDSQAAGTGACAIPVYGGRQPEMPDRGTFSDLSGTGQIPDEPIPERIAVMRRMFEYGSGSFQDRVDNFCRQGEYMADYTDDAPWDGFVYRISPTYHDLNIRQLRGYFTWRTGVRHGILGRAPEAFGVIYVDELLCGIGCSGPIDTYEKLKTFRDAIPASDFAKDTGGPSGTFQAGLRRWLFDYCVLADLPKELAGEAEDPFERERCLALAVLEDPEAHTDEEIISALSFFAPGKFPQSPVFTKSDRGKHLFALIWKQMSSSYSVKGRTIFAACFGGRKPFSWYPLSGALFRLPAAHEDRIYDLHPGRRFFFRNGHWMVERYDGLSSNRTLFPTILHESERRLREFLKVGRPLKADPLEAWVDPYIDSAVAREKEEVQKARLDAISFNTDDLNTIRADAAVTRDSLLTEEERAAEEAENRKDGAPELVETDKKGNFFEIADGKGDGAGETGSERMEIAPADTGTPVFGTHEDTVLRLLLSGQSPVEYIQANHLFASVIADAINEALFDAIGDTAVECDGSVITLVEDYREDIAALLDTEK